MSETQYLGQLEVVKCEEPKYVELNPLKDDLLIYLQSMTEKGEVWAETNGFEHPEESFEDDGFIHITSGKYKICFYNGQDKGCWTEKSIPRLLKLVKKAILLHGDKNE